MKGWYLRSKIVRKKKSLSDFIPSALPFLVDCTEEMKRRMRRVVWVR